MKARFLRYIIASLILITNTCLGQEYYDATNSPRQYYYNNLESATASTPSSFLPSCASTRSTPSAIEINTSSMTNGGTKSFGTVGSSTWGYVAWNFLGNSTTGTNTSLNNSAWEWEFDYKNTTGKYTYNPDSVLSTSGAGSCGMVAGKDSWKYWLIANGYSGNSTLGLYVTQSAGQLKVVRKYSSAANGTQTYLTMSMPNNNHTYQIRIVRSVSGFWNFYVFDRTTSTTTTSLDVANDSQGVNINLSEFANYNLSYLEATSAAADRFEWDNFNFYQVRLDYLPVIGNGVSNPIYPGMGTAIIYGIALSARGDIMMGRMAFNYNADVTKLFSANQNNASLYEKSTLPLSTTGATFLKNCTLQNNGTSTQLDLSDLKKRYYSGGNTDGTTKTVTYYFLNATVLSTFASGYPTSVTYSVSTTNNDTFSQFYSSSSPYSSSSSSSVSSPTSNGDVWDWTGAQSSWSGGAWKKNTSSSSSSSPSVSTDIVRIGVVNYTGGTNQPSIPSGTTISIGSIEFGKYGSSSSTTAAAVTLTAGNKDISILNGITIDASADVTIDGNTNNNGNNKTSLLLNTGSTSTIASTAILRLKNGLSLANSGTLTLKSDASGSAAIAALPSGTSITGTVNVERYVSGGTGRRGYRLLSSPVNQGTISGTGQLGYGFTDLQATTPVTGYGATGTYSTTQPSNGFDPSPTGNPSVFYYYEPDKDPTSSAISKSDYKGLNSISEKFFTGMGYLFFFRGNRNTSDGSNNAKLSTAAIPENTTLKFSGTLNQGGANGIDVYIPTNPVSTVNGNKVYITPTSSGAISKTFSYTNNPGLNNGLQLVGNPYACTIDLDKITLTNPGTTSIYMLNNSGTMSAYTYHSGGSGLLNGVGRYVLPGQGFFIMAKSTGNTSLNFPESCKVTTIPSVPITFAVGVNNVSVLNGGVSGGNLSSVPSSGIEQSPEQALKVSLMLDSINMNETLIQFSPGGKNKFDAFEDAYYRNGLTQTTFMASYTSDSQPCIINQMSTLDSIKTIKLYAEGLTSGIYKMQFTGASSIDPRYKLFLKDNFKNDSLDLSTNSTYSFNIDRANAKTYGDSRFTIVVQPTNIANLYNLISFTGIKNSDGVLVSWKTQYEGDYTGFILQRSTDNWKTFSALTTLQSNGTGVYSFTDISPSAGINQYRLVQNNINNVNIMSDVISVSYLTTDSHTNKLKIFPNPVNTTIQMDLGQDNSTTLMVNIYSIIGLQMINSKFTPGSTLSIDVSKLAKGAYIIEVTDTNNKHYGSATFTKL